ncbi:MAG: helix-turn-helix domain-containing protein [Peptostreptococcaceae bacterium]|nr:helix-turn-helix domain-containing protein [Peptostreptococcaceae bacterium]
MKDICYINDLERLKALADPLRVNLLTALGTTKKNSQQLAKALKINRTKIHYHLNILEEMGFIEVVDTDLINGIMQKYYLPTARAFVPAPNIFNEIFHTDSIGFSVKKSEENEFLEEFEKLKKKYGTTKKDADSVNFSLIKL